jgi:hypothetical protein
MRRPWIDRLRKCCLQLLDLFRSRAQKCDARVCIPSAFFVVNDHEALSQRVSTSGKSVGFGGLKTAAP